MATNTLEQKSITKILSNAIASVEMEGYVFSEHHKKLCEAVVLGKMSKKEMIESLLAAKS